MLKKLQVLEEPRVTRLVSHLERHKDRLAPDVSRYAQGRQRYWLNYEWDLASKTFSHAVKDKRLWTFCKEVFPGADLGLVVYGGVGIDLHRDDSYADWLGVGVNLGKVEAWLYDCQYPEYRWTSNQNPPNPKRYKLGVGDVFQFNTKNPHSAVNPAHDRWALFLWRVSRKLRPQFHRRF